MGEFFYDVKIMQKRTPFVYELCGCSRVILSLSENVVIESDAAIVTAIVAVDGAVDRLRLKGV